MPRHPPCALTHLTTTRCSHPLCNTQHTTTPQPHEDHHNHTGCIRSTGPEAAAREQHPIQRVPPQDPTACQTMRQQRTSSEMFHPATPTEPAPTGTDLLDQVWNSERRPSPTSRS